MKSICLTISTAAVVSATPSITGLLNLHNHSLLSSNKDVVSPLESIAYIATFDEVPIFGGQELRKEMLAQGVKA